MIEVKNIYSSEDIVYESGDYSITARVGLTNGEFTSIPAAHFSHNGKISGLAVWGYRGFELGADIEINADIESFVEEASAAIAQRYGFEMPEENDFVEPVPPTENDNEHQTGE